MAFDIGSMVRARGRDWVVLPDSSADFLLLKPLGGSDAEITGVYTGADGGEEVTSAAFAPPSPMKFATERYGGFVQLSYKLTDFGFGDPAPRRP